LYYVIDYIIDIDTKQAHSHKKRPIHKNKAGYFARKSAAALFCWLAGGRLLPTATSGER
jgi:hypothetical protein